MALNEEERKKRRQEANRKYYLKNKGTKQGEKNKRNTRRSRAEKFIEDEATRAELAHFRDLIAERQKKLSKKA
ncbi:hypothetical protein [Lactobacillus gasseri]|uniref:Uncharacterized protein n=1 Tax=Lactobacillus gasseri TaxID=1596 RepID=A0AB33C9R4_LACGS|nr:hypothetical protein [Lactobacillus gasseri]ART99181.1 hypothetical protein CCE30_09945 [Lactobacillus gasseri]